jgi:hypothetical protein
VLLLLLLVVVVLVVLLLLLLLFQLLMLSLQLLLLLPPPLLLLLLLLVLTVYVAPASGQPCAYSSETAAACNYVVFGQAEGQHLACSKDSNNSSGSSSSYALHT